jgi:thiol-disulfide isomerase/thioredoxin
VWATWCEPCRDSLPLYVDLRKEFGRDGFEVIAINVDDDPIQIPLFLNETKIGLPIVIDPHSVQSNKVLKVKVMPTTYLIDRKGVIRWVHEGFNEDMLSTWLDEIQTLVAEKP